MAKTTTISATQAQRLKTEMFQAAHSIGVAFGNYYNHKFQGAKIEHRFVNFLDVPVTIATVAQGKRIKHPKLAIVGAHSVNAVFRDSFAGGARMGWAVDSFQISCSDALDSFFRFISRNATELTCAASVIRDKETQAEELHIYVSTTNLEGDQMCNMHVIIESVEVVQMRAVTPQLFKR